MNSPTDLASWLDDVYLPRLHARDDALIYDRQSPWESGDRFSERFLQIIWNERYLTPDLHCISGHALRIIHPGTWNVAAGPDFHNAALAIDGKLVRGDVEIHQRTSDWNHHGHDHDPLYRAVILHVVWEHDIELVNGPQETFILNGNLPPSWHILLQDVEDASYPYARQVAAGQCALQWALADDASLQSVLASAGMARLEAKGNRLLRLCAEHGTDQALYETLFDCLGFHKNRQPFRELAELAPLERLRNLNHGHDIEAYLFGMAGLLPDPTCEPVLPEWRDYVSSLWDTWWRIGGDTLELPWQTAGSRPFNSPQRRLMAGIEWLKMTDFQPYQWLMDCIAPAQSPRQLYKILMSFTLPNHTWNAYKDFKTRLRKPVSLLGHSRLMDIAANLFLPFLCVHNAANDRDNGMANLARQAYTLLTPGQDNRLLIEAAHRFLTPPSRSRELVKRYCHQQGLLDIYKNFCLVFSSDCQNCPFAQKETISPV